MVATTTMADTAEALSGDSGGDLLVQRVATRSGRGSVVANDISAVRWRRYGEWLDIGRRDSSMSVFEVRPDVACVGARVSCHAPYRAGSLFILVFASHGPLQCSAAIRVRMMS